MLIVSLAKVTFSQVKCLDWLIKKSDENVLAGKTERSTPEPDYKFFFFEKQA